MVGAGVVFVLLSGRSPDDGKRPSGSPAAGEPVDATVAVDGGVRFQRVDGFGTSELVFDDPHVFENFDARTGRAKTVVPARARAEIYDKLYRGLKLTRVRQNLQEGVEPRNDNADPGVADGRKFDFRWKRADAHIDYAKEAASRGARVYFPSPVRLETWMEGSAGTPAEYTEWAMAMLRRWRSRGREPRYYSPINEPGFYDGRKTAWQGSGSSGFSPEYLRDVVKLLGRRLRAAGFSTKLVIPDDVRPSEAERRARLILDDPAARPYVGALATHLYGDPDRRAVDYAGLGDLERLARRHRLPLWMTEFYWPDPLGFADIAHRLLADYDVSAIDYLWGFFGQWQANRSQLITINSDPQTAAYAGYRLEKQYYVFGQFSRFIAPGSRRIKADASERSLQVTAYSKGQRVSLVAHNTTSRRRTVRLNLLRLPEVDDLRGIRTDRGESWAAVAAKRSGAQSFVVTLPPESITSLAN